eukprot:752106-Hanusia_phi.AAC.3
MIVLTPAPPPAAGPGGRGAPPSHHDTERSGTGHGPGPAPAAAPSTGGRSPEWRHADPIFFNTGPASTAVPGEPPPARPARARARAGPGVLSR